MARSYEELLDAVLEAVEAKHDMDCELYEEGVLSNPLGKFVEKLKDIKKKKPSEYDGPAEIQKFVDENYKDIEDATALLEKEPEDLRANQLRYLAGLAIGYVGWIGGAILGAATGAAALGAGIMVVSGLFLFIGSIVTTIITYIRTSNDRKAMDDLSKIRDSLAKLDRNKLPAPLKKKVSDIIAKIDDAEIEINARLKTVKTESVEDIDALLEIYESARAGVITEEERDSLLSIFSEQGEDEE